MSTVPPVLRAFMPASLLILLPVCRCKHCSTPVAAHSVTSRARLHGPEEDHVLPESSRLHISLQIFRSFDGWTRASHVAHAYGSFALVRRFTADKCVTNNHHQLMNVFVTSEKNRTVDVVVLFIFRAPRMKGLSSSPEPSIEYVLPSRPIFICATST